MHRRGERPWRSAGRPWDGGGPPSAVLCRLVDFKQLHGGTALAVGAGDGLVHCTPSGFVPE